MPGELACVGVEGNNGAAVEVVSEPGSAIPVGAGISSAPIRQIQIGIICTCDPDGRATVHPRIAAPCFMTRFTGARNGVESPHFFSSVDVPRGNETAHAELTAGRARDDFVFDDEWSVSKRVALLRIGRRSI